MPEIIQNWLGTTLGVVLDMSPEKFGRNTKDGKLLAQLLYNYGVIPIHVLNNVKESQNYYECYNNLVMLKPWLKYIGVAHDDSTFQKMAGGEGSAAISVFYAVYLNLERNDRLHYLSSQKERRQSIDSCQKFKVNWVPELCVSGASGDIKSDLSAPLLEKRDMIEWHKAKCKDIVEQIKRTQSKFRKAVYKKSELGPLVSKHVTSRPFGKPESEAEETKGSISAFEKTHPQDNADLSYSELLELQNMNELQPCFGPSMSEAKNILDNLKRRRKGDTYARSFQQKMQNMLLDEQWREIVQKQDKDFENVVCANLLKQSQYEKQMAKKLYLIRNQKKVLAENRRKIECLKVEQFQKDYDEMVQEEVEMKGEQWEMEKLEKERIAELHRRLYDSKARQRREEIKIECRKLFEALLDISVRISEVRELIGCQVPKTFMKDLKELFFKGLPIFDLFERFEELYDNEIQPYVGVASEGFGEDEEVFNENLEQECLKREEKERQNVLDECDFNDYINLAGPWMVELLFPNGSETEVKHLVLGYIVHKLLAVKYPPPNVPIRVDIKPMKPAAVVQGLSDDTAVNMFIDLMEACRILVVKVNDAINFVLFAYKEELSVVRDIDLTFLKVTQDALGERRSSVKEKECKKKSQMLKKESTEESPFEEDEFMDKEVQTPRIIPDDDPLLSPNAELGKIAFEALGAGDPVPDIVIIPAVIAYVSSKQKDYDGWVLLNYPLLYSQASELELRLTGFKILPAIEAMETLETAEEFTYRGPWGDHFSRDVFGENRFSKLVPKLDLFSLEETTPPKTYFDSFIKLKKLPETPRRRSQDYEDVGALEKFYSDVNILINFEYQNLNFQTIKNLGRIVLKGDATTAESWGVDQKSSVEVFGNVILELKEKWGSRRRSTRETIRGPKKVIKEPSVNLDSLEFLGEEVEEKVEVNGHETTKTPEIPPQPPKPGDPSWEWATGPQPEPLLLALASLWENMEVVYIEDFKKLFFALRVHRSSVRNYCGFIRKSTRTVMRRPDEKQKVLSDFQQMFNEIDEDLRPDVDIKCELHVRVSELEQALMNMADERKSNSVKDVTSVAQDGWVADEMANLVNIFLAAIQLEADRCIDSYQVIMDYYVSLQQKPLDEKQLAKVSVPKLIIQNQKYSIFSSGSNKTTLSSSPRNSDLKRSIKSLSEQGSKLTQDRSSKTRSFTDKRKRSSEHSMAGAAEFVSGILTNLRLPEDGMTPFHCFFIDSVHLIANEIKATAEVCFLEVKKIDKPAPSANKGTKNNSKISETKMVPSNENLFAEWTTALENELSRFLFRTQVILARGVFEINEFLTTILNILSSLMEEATEMYMKEIQSIAECCKIFKCGIEKEVQIKPLLELKGDELFVHMDDVDPSQEESFDFSVEDENQRFRFTVEQLALLFYKLQKVAPDGEIIKRSLVYIIQDLRMLKCEVENCFPEIWDDIEPDDVTTIFNELYLDLEVVHWKDFIIYALDLPLPTELDILSMRTAFRNFDPLVKELISLEHYESIVFWFEDQDMVDCKEKERMEKAKQLLFRMYQVDELQTNYSALLLAFCKDVNPELGFLKALALAMGKMISMEEEEEEEREPQIFFGEAAYSESELFGGSHQVSLKKPVCCSTNSTEVTVKCVPKEKIVRCECKDNVETSVKESENEENSGFFENEGEDGFFYRDFKPYRASSVVSVIPYNILSSLLKASFPSLPQLSILLDCEQTFSETLNSIYDNLESLDNSVKVRKLINHKFIHSLIHCTNKFKFVRLKSILLSVAKPKPRMPRAVCVTEKPNVTCCLRN